MFDAAPRNHHLLSTGEWKTFLDDACEGDWPRFFCRSVGILHIQAMNWGRPNPRHGHLEAPSIRLVRDGRATELAEFIRSLSVSRKDAQDAIRRDMPKDSPLPLSPTLFFRKPFVELSDDIVCTPTPRVILDQCITGLWNRFREHAGRIAKRSKHKDSEIWTRAFGDIFELWCHRVARETKLTEGEEVILKDVGASDQIEDVVIRSPRGVALFSVKARLLKESVFKGASSPAESVRILDDMLFKQPNGASTGTRERRGGALRLLDDTVARARKALSLTSDTVMIPVLVSYDQYGLDNEPCYRWAQERCATENLLQDCCPITFMTIREFEVLMALGEQGHSIVEFLIERSRIDDGRYPVQLLLAKRGANSFTEALETAIDTLTEEVTTHVSHVLEAPK